MRKGAGEGERREREWEGKRERGSPIKFTRTPSSSPVFPPAHHASTIIFSTAMKEHCNGAKIVCEKSREKEVEREGENELVFFYF